MPKSAKAPQQVPLLFVEANSTRKGRSKESRAFVARVNRAKQKLRQVAQATGYYSNSTVSRPAGEKSQHQHVDNDIPHRRRHGSEELPSTPEVLQALRIAAARRTQSAPRVPQTIAPAFGGVSIESFDLKDSAEAAAMACYTFTYVVDAWLDPAHKPAWVKAFFTSPLVYHSLSFSCGILQDVSSGRPIQTRRLFHKLKTIQGIHQQLGQVDKADTEPLMLAITTLWRINTDKIAQRNAVPLLFSPHVRSASWVAIFGTLGGDGSHANA